MLPSSTSALLSSIPLVILFAFCKDTSIKVRGGLTHFGDGGNVNIIHSKRPSFYPYNSGRLVDPHFRKVVPSVWVIFPVGPKALEFP